MPELNPQEQDQYYLNVIKRLEELEAKTRSGEILTAEETESLNQLSSEFENLRTGNPQKFNQLVNFINTTRQQAGTTGPGGEKDVSGLLSTTFSERSRQNIQEESLTRQVSRTYVDLPTPEEFLDDFTNAYNIHITGLVQSGAIRPEVASFAREMQTEVFGEYLREQTARLLKGEPLWKVVGLDADEQLLGARQGESFARHTDSTLQAKTGTTRTESVSGGAGAGTPAESVSGAGRAVEQGGTSSGTEEFTQNRSATDTTQATEFIMGRNKLSYVANLAPLDFFKDKATAQRLNFLYAGQKGTAQRAAQTAAGGEYAGARRV